MDGWGSWGAARYAQGVAAEVLREMRVDEVRSESDLIDRAWDVGKP